MFLKALHLSAFLSASFCDAFPASLVKKDFFTLKATCGNDVPDIASNTNPSFPSTRKAFLGSMVISSAGISFINGDVANADEGFESIAARAAQISKIVESEEAKKEVQDKAATQIADSRTVYDFSVPVAGDDVPFKNLIKQEFTSIEISGENEGETITKTDAKVKAILVVNIKQDDPLARRNIPELISLVSK